MASKELKDSVDMPLSAKRPCSQTNAVNKRARTTALGTTKRHVRFAAKPDVFYFQVLHEEGNQEEEAVAESSEKKPSSLRRTSELTLLSSLHGQARRELRSIDKFDLQSAVKYGVKSRAQNCRKTGEPRWKYIYGNVVYITDSTSTQEVTCYKQAVNIQHAPISQEMIDRHKEDAQALKDDPQLCTTHSIIVVDQSGSMRNCDVKGFKTRSDAAYGVLALEYIAEQLHTHGEEDQGVDAVSVIEMSDNASLVIDREPLDWILFNKILARQRNATPKSHGNYNPALIESCDLISRETLEVGEDDRDDLPSYMLIFLSDGKPSDSTAVDNGLRLRILIRLASKLQSKLTFCAMGLGRTKTDFQSLIQMAAAVEEVGGSGTCEYAQLSAAKLSQAFTSMASSVTTTRNEMLSVHSNNESAKKKNVTLRGKHVSQDERRFIPYKTDVSRWRFDHKKFRAREYPWSSASFKNKSAIGFEIEDKPFGEGAERLAYMFYETDHTGKQLGRPMVAKESNRIDSEERKVAFHSHFCRVQRKANELASLFNKAVKKAQKLKPVEAWVRLPQISFLKCHVYEYVASDGTVCGLLVEEYLKGKFTKYNGNNGFVSKRKSGPQIDLDIGTVFLSDFLQAFSHWAYVESDHNLLVCDLQGVLNEEGRHPRFQLTDPCICSRRSPRYGKTDLGVKGYRNFRRTHDCNAVCRGLGLPSFGSRKNS